MRKEDVANTQDVTDGCSTGESVLALRRCPRSAAPRRAASLCGFAGISVRIGIDRKFLEDKLAGRTNTVVEQSDWTSNRSGVMPAKRETAAACGLVLSLLWAPLTFAQAPRRYQPATPTVSPYLNLTRSNVGGLPNYYSLVRPQLQQQAFNNQQRVLNAQQQALQIQQSAAVDRLRNSLQQTIAPTGKRAGFMTYGPSGSFSSAAPYYPQPSVTRRR